MLHGIDVASYEPSFDTEGLDFVIVKATEGRSYKNPERAQQVARARRAGCVVGFYHFLHGRRGLRPARIVAQARYFVAHCGAEDGDFLALDWETDPKGRRATSAQKDKFLRTVKKLRPKHRIVLYCNRDLWTRKSTGDYHADGLWIADYRKAGHPLIHDEWLIHQYTSHPLDKNVAKFKTRNDMKKWAARK
ncbi:MULTISPECIES: glycoside hydrolase family 25 protein [Actinomadura]|uniref:Glycoside hydrolase family 25 protein n=1 Tax=Actinomadura yumaensis TaxID=111807 RepID=A0ABW2CRE8_9ACTN|nr:GH25 family lysozyme [Actinomadura sp. J1-007]MWK35183.1 muramidase [Actinomadura sp. J1-007]